MSLQTVIEYLGTRKFFGGRIRQVGYDLHAALTDDAHWDAEYWDFHLDRLEAAKERIRTEYLNSANGIAFGALWVSEPVEREIEESIDGLLRRFDEGRIGKRETYIIRK